MEQRFKGGEVVRQTDNWESAYMPEGTVSWKVLGKCNSKVFLYINTTDQTECKKENRLAILISLPTSKQCKQNKKDEKQKEANIIITLIIIITGILY